MCRKKDSTKSRTFQKKNQKIFFFLSKKFTSGGPQGCSQPLWGSVGTYRSLFWPFRKKRFFDFFSIFQLFLAGYVGLQNFGFGPTYPPKVNKTCSTQHFLTSWVSGDYVRTLVDHHRDSFGPLCLGFLFSPEDRLRWHFGGHTTQSGSILDLP